jgi:hypothetical protein
VDTDPQADAAWILGVQRKLYQWSQAHPNEAWRDMRGVAYRPSHAPSCLAARRFEPRCTVCPGRWDNRGELPEERR